MGGQMDHMGQMGQMGAAGYGGDFGGAGAGGCAGNNFGYGAGGAPVQAAPMQQLQMVAPQAAMMSQVPDDPQAIQMQKQVLEMGSLRGCRSPSAGLLGRIQKIQT